MNILIPIAIIAIILVFFGLKWNNFRTRLAFLFILFGVLFILLTVFLITSGENFDFSSIGKFFSMIRVYFLWVKGLVINIFEVTGRMIGLDINTTNSTIFSR